MSMVRTCVCAAGLAGLWSLAAVAGQAPPAAGVQAPPQVYRSGVDLIESDVTVVDRDGRPVEGLTAADFVVTVDGTPRRVAALTPVKAGGPSTASAATGASPAPPASSATRSAAGPAPASPAGTQGRVFFIAVDRNRIMQNAGRTHLEAAVKFVDSLGPDDRVGLWMLPFPAPVEDREQLKRELTKAAGTFVGRPPGPGRDVSLALTESLQAIESMINAIAPIAGTKHLVLITGGNPVPINDIAEVQRVARAAAAGRVHVHALQVWNVLDDLRTDLDSRPANMAAYGAGAGATLRTADQDATAEAMTALVTGGVTVTSPQGSAAFNRLSRELASWYVLGVEPLPADRDGAQHRLAITVPGRKGVTVRARQAFAIR